jgi:hypothetical protein
MNFKGIGRDSIFILLMFFWTLALAVFISQLHVIFEKVGGI